MQALCTISKFQVLHSNIFMGIKIKGGRISESFSFCLPPPTHGEEQKEKESWNNAIIILYVSEYYFAAESTML